MEISTTIAAPKDSPMTQGGKIGVLLSFDRFPYMGGRNIIIK